MEYKDYNISSVEAVLLFDILQTGQKILEELQKQNISATIVKENQMPAESDKTEKPDEPAEENILGVKMVDNGKQKKTTKTNNKKGKAKGR